ncbi:MAG: HEAT repeat domain-containing protein [Planctomycetota bacterium]
MTSTIQEDPRSTIADWESFGPEGTEPSETPQKSQNTKVVREKPAQYIPTTTEPFEHFEFYVSRLGQSKDRYGAPWGADFRRRLGEQIMEAGNPVRRVEVVVRHCCERPSQLKIEDGSDVLSEVSRHLVRFIEEVDPLNFPESSVPQWYNRVWLYADAMGLATDIDTRADRIRILCKWLNDSDSSVRESAANALGALCAHEAKSYLSNRLSIESCSAVKEAIADAIMDLDDA